MAIMVVVEILHLLVATSALMGVEVDLVDILLVAQAVVVVELLERGPLVLLAEPV
jgi:hypothetical protein